MPTGIIVDVQRACGFAGCRTHAPGEFRKLFVEMQSDQCFLPVLPIHQVVGESGMMLLTEATTLTERNTAVHATRTWIFASTSGQRDDEFLM